MDQALKVWGTEKGAYLPEISRTSFLEAKILFCLGGEQSALAHFKQATAGFETLVPREQKEYRDLEEVDFDALVTFRSK